MSTPTMSIRSLGMLVSRVVSWSDMLLSIMDKRASKPARYSSRLSNRRIGAKLANQGKARRILSSGEFDSWNRRVTVASSLISLGSLYSNCSQEARRHKMLIRGRLNFELISNGFLANVLRKLVNWTCSDEATQQYTPCGKCLWFGI